MTLHVTYNIYHEIKTKEDPLGNRVTLEVKSHFLMYLVLRVRLPYKLLPGFIIDLGISQFGVLHVMR